MRYVKRAVLVCGTAALLCWLFSVAAYATGSGDVAGAVESTWAAASGQIKTVVNNVVWNINISKRKAKTNDSANVR